MYNKYVKNLAPRFARASTFLLPQAIQGLGALRSPFAFDHLGSNYLRNKNCTTHNYIK